ncbi:hypothetical protein HK102_005139, partial [Quaeritorhiza haematococci]
MSYVKGKFRPKSSNGQQGGRYSNNQSKNDSNDGNGNGNASTDASIERFEEVQKRDELDEKMGFYRFTDGDDKMGWLINMHP